MFPMSPFFFYAPHSAQQSHMHGEHNGSAALRRSAMSSKLALIKRILPSSHSLFLSLSPHFLPFQTLPGVLYQLGETPTREKSQTIKVH